MWFAGCNRDEGYVTIRLGMSKTKSLPQSQEDIEWGLAKYGILPEATNMIDSILNTSKQIRIGKGVGMTKTNDG